MYIFVEKIRKIIFELSSIPLLSGALDKRYFFLFLRTYVASSHKMGHNKCFLYSNRENYPSVIRVTQCRHFH